MVAQKDWKNEDPKTTTTAAATNLAEAWKSSSGRNVERRSKFFSVFGEEKGLRFEENPVKSEGNL